jgi:hypothetical protein
MSKFDSKKYKNAKEVAEGFFRKNSKINSAALGEVVLNSAGLSHLIWKDEKRKHKRDWKNQVKRFHLLQYARQILANMSYYQEYLENLEEIKGEHHGKVFKENKIIKYWGFIAIIEDKIRIKIILRKIGNGNIHFWSIIPIWKTEGYKNIKIVTLHKGDLKED